MGRETTNKWGIKLSTMPGRKLLGYLESEVSVKNVPALLKTNSS